MSSNCPAVLTAQRAELSLEWPLWRDSVPWRGEGLGLPLFDVGGGGAVEAPPGCPAPDLAEPSAPGSSTHSLFPADPQPESVGSRAWYPL